jgi:hypothetical protein
MSLILSVKFVTFGQAPALQSVKNHEMRVIYLKFSSQLICRHDFVCLLASAGAAARTSLPGRCGARHCASPCRTGAARCRRREMLFKYLFLHNF